MFGEFKVPEAVYAGRGALQMLPQASSSLGKRALIVTDEVMERLGYVAQMQRMLAEAGVQADVFAEVNTEPTDVHVETGVRAFLQHGCDHLIALGGGSAIDAAKGISVMAVHEGYIGDYMGGRRTFDKAPYPVIAIPTTAGTGSEVTSVTVITNTKDDVKMMIRQPALLPKVAIVDPQLTVSSPPHVTASSGVDALCHAIEAFISRRSHPLTDALATDAAKKIVTYLERAYNDGQDLEAREGMAIAALEAGMAFTNSSVCLVHGMSRPIGALFHVPHGFANAMLLPTVLEFRLDDYAPRLALLARALNPELSGASDGEAAAWVVRRVKTLAERLQIPNLKTWGIERDAFERALDKMANDALASGSPANHPVVPSHEEIVQLYRQAYDATWDAAPMESLTK
ncbi:iron-containing alcohol dehydrogenase [Alicyclobacillus acidocaldarius]|uniref:Iron-containing alcohol dehydrogenase n=1 Tax=Alicyclobacillus acidocaldarius subsp. acidocaldarius (strain ATCC 27009 / DSM 446 / BCRC 14685 / JCM 5260 / KCTC 1825 / NBRC 15652 / NCIMB 11725 / NRRL B-14509 / 104-IA) TaxID=521098 RepID=C8WS66_ALIAD|nr:iron-containing alcohol dehydrogenase [Alicyclobacillus acidocaldarius]ACV57500.1 iron-containing alcohol dehydrogenase [Alicyclobacillus acidocaldarius subsp. acidocaldarius DSM 446]